MEAPSGPPRREARARELGAREQVQREQEQLQRGRREQQAREQQARELDQRERQQRERDAREQAVREQAERKQDERVRKAREQAQRKQKQKPRQQEAREHEPREQAPRKQEPRKQEEPRKQDRSQPPKSASATKPVQPAQRGRSSRRSRRSMTRRIVWLAAGALLVAVAVAVAVAKTVARSGSGTAHVLVTPPRLGSYARNQALAGAMDADALRAGIVRRSSGEAKNVVDAVYEDTTGPAAKAGPQIVLFIGGNLTGASANAFISSLTGKFKGAVTVGPGSLGGHAVCVPSVSGRLAECAWADNDTFGVIASPTLSKQALASELRRMRPLVEHAAK